MPAELLISAKFPGKCKRCGYRIDVDDWIYYDPAFKHARHKKCPETSYDGTEQATIFNTWVQRAQEMEGTND